MAFGPRAVWHWGPKPIGFEAVVGAVGGTEEGWIESEDWRRGRTEDSGEASIVVADVALLREQLEKRWLDHACRKQCRTNTIAHRLYIAPILCEAIGTILEEQ